MEIDGLEPTTPALQRRCSPKLSYIPIAEYDPVGASMPTSGGFSPPCQAPTL
jgi:hypothetical protein